DLPVEVVFRYAQEDLRRAVRIEGCVGHVLAAHVHVRSEARDGRVSSDLGDPLHFRVRTAGWNHELELHGQTGDVYLLRRLLGKDERHLRAIDGFRTVGRVVYLQDDVMAGAQELRDAGLEDEARLVWRHAGDVRRPEGIAGTGRLVARGLRVRDHMVDM